MVSLPMKMFFKACSRVTFRKVQTAAKEILVNLGAMRTWIFLFYPLSSGIPAGL